MAHMAQQTAPAAHARGTFMGMIIGMVTGMIGGILIAPRSGRETRQRIKQTANDKKDMAEDKAKRALEEGKQEARRIKP